jgi:hypothetical protein
VTKESSQRDAAGRLYAAFESVLVLQALAPATILLNEEVVSASSGKRSIAWLRERVLG